jgi:hypothetical protein
VDEGAVIIICWRQRMYDEEEGCGEDSPGWCRTTRKRYLLLGGPRLSAERTGTLSNGSSALLSETSLATHGGGVIPR